MNLLEEKQLMGWKVVLKLIGKLLFKESSVVMKNLIKKLLDILRKLNKNFQWDCNNLC